LDKVQPNHSDALLQHSELSATLTKAGVSCQFLDSHPGLPYQCFVRDSAVMTPWGLIILKMGFDRRSLEPLNVANYARAHDIPIWKVIEDGSLEGGDIQLLRPGLAVIGFGSGRTTKKTAELVKSYFDMEGWECRIINYSSSFVHLDLVLGVLGDTDTLVCKSALSDKDLAWLVRQGYCLHEVSYAEASKMACNVLSIGTNRIVSSSNNRRVNNYLRTVGFDVLEVNISHFLDLDGGVHCLTLPLLRSEVSK
jgi:N-dimethylarginine dimethylaminohydrolase